MYTKAKIDVNKVLDNLKPHLNKLPKKIGLATTIQFIDYLDQVKQFLIDNEKEVFIGNSNINKGQLLGCNTNTISDIYSKVDGLLYFGDGIFHPKGLTVHMRKPLFCFDPFSYEFKLFENEDFDKIIGRIKGAALKFFDSKNVGILVSTKSGQSHLARAEKFAKYCESQGKKAFILLNETLDFNSLQDFNFIEVFVNTMCARIGYDDTVKIFAPTINFDDLLNFLDDYEDKNAYNLMQIKM